MLRPTLAGCAASHGGVFTRTEALAHGYAAHEIRAATRTGGPWGVIRRGVYAERATWEAATDDGRYGLEVRAALVGTQTEAVASHQSAAALQTMPLRPRWRTSLHTTRPGVGGTRRENGVQVHPASLDPRDLVEVDGFPVTGMARTAVDIARDGGYLDGLVAADAALRAGVRHDELRRVVSGMSHWPGVRSARAVVDDADGGAANPGETLARALVAELGLGRPETQFEVTDGVRTAWVDLRIGPLLVEFDGRIKYLCRDEGGVSDLAPSEVVWREKRREDWLRRLGYAVERIIWSELFGTERRRTQVRIRSAYAAACRRIP